MCAETSTATVVAEQIATLSQEEIDSMDNDTLIRLYKETGDE